MMQFNPDLFAGLILIAFSIAAYCLTDIVEW